MPIATINPATGETLKTFDELSEQQLERKLQSAANAFRSYKNSSFAERAELMLRAATILETDKSRLARLMTTEMGKPIKGAIGIGKVRSLCVVTMPRMPHATSRMRWWIQMPAAAMCNFNCTLDGLAHFGSH